MLLSCFNTVHSDDKQAFELLIRAISVTIMSNAFQVDLFFFLRYLPGHILLSLSYIFF